MHFLQDCHRNDAPTMLHPSIGLEKWSLGTHSCLQNANKVPGGGRGGLIPGTGPGGRPPLWFWGFTGSHFLLTSWEPLGGWGINSAFVFLCKRDSLASPWAELEGKGKNNATGDSTPTSGFGNCHVQPSRVLWGYLLRLPQSLGTGRKSLQQVTRFLSHWPKECVDSLQRI